jgi:hypothetical protein
MCEEVPDWLPELLEWRGDWSSFVEQVYAEFRADLLEAPAHFQGQRVAVRRDPLDQGKVAGFWHAISEGSDEEERIPDLRRCERIRWIRALVECPDPAEVRVWETKRGSDRRVLFALDDFSYVVVLAKRRSYMLFLTAFLVKKRHRRRKLEKEWKVWCDAQKG